MKVINTNIDGRHRRGSMMFTNEAYELFEWMDTHVGPRNTAWNAYQKPTDSYMSIILWDESKETMIRLRWL